MINIGNKTISDIAIGGKTVMQIDINGKTAYKKTEDFLRITNTSSSSGTFTCTKNGTPNAPNVEISTDGSTWTTQSMSKTWTATVNAGGSICLRGNNSAFNTSNTTYYSFSMNRSFDVSGNIICLINYTNPSSVITIPQYFFYGLFKNSVNLVNSANLNFGNVTIVDKWGLYDTFNGCSGLMTGPNFSNITTVNERGAQYAFENCTSLTTTSDLTNITSVGTYGCLSMFSGCSNLVTAYAPNISWKTGKMSSWLQNVAATGTVYAKSTAYNSITSGTSGLPSGWNKSLIS